MGACKTLVLFTALACLATIAGCASSVDSNGSAGASRSVVPPARPEVKPRLTFASWANFSESALTRYDGTLIVGRDRCVGLQIRSSTSRYVLMWRGDERVSPDGNAVLVGRLGARVFFGKPMSLVSGFRGAKVPAYCDKSFWSGMLGVKEPV